MRRECVKAAQSHLRSSGDAGPSGVAHDLLKQRQIHTIRAASDFRKRICGWNHTRRKPISTTTQRKPVTRAGPSARRPSHHVAATQARARKQAQNAAFTGWACHHCAVLSSSWDVGAICDSHNGTATIMHRDVLQSPYHPSPFQAGCRLGLVGADGDTAVCGTACRDTARTRALRQPALGPRPRRRAYRAVTTAPG